MPDISLPAGQVNLKGPQAPNAVGIWHSTISSLTVTGLALVVAIAIDVPAGALVHTGRANANLLEHPVGQLRWAGLAPSLNISNTSIDIAVPAGTQTWTGLAAVVREGDVGVEIPAGQLVIKGPQRPAFVPQLGVGSLAFTSLALVVSEDTPGSAASIPAGSLVFAGQAPDRIAGFAIATPVGALTLTGQYPSVAFKGLDVGRLTWQGFALAIGGAGDSIGITIPVGALVMGQTALVPSLQYDFVQAIPAGAIVLTGFEPNAGTSESLVLQVGSLQLAGQAPTIDWGTGLGVGSLPHTGYALHVEIAVGALDVPTGELVWHGYAPTLVHSNGLLIASTVRITRSLGATGRITRTISSVVSR